MLTYQWLLLVEIKSEDAVYVLAYSVIMLNTDLHNPQIRASNLFRESLIFLI